MKLIRELGERAAKTGSYRMVRVGLYYCPACGEGVVLPTSYARNKSSCGCLEKSLKWTVYRPKSAARTCLMCGKKFDSHGPHNRRCAVCNHKLENEGQTYYMPTVYKENTPGVAANCGKD